MARRVTPINQDLDEGLYGDPRALHLAIMRAAVRKLIENPDGSHNWIKARDIAGTAMPPLSPQTVINFAYGQTRQPSPWTLRALAPAANVRFGMIPNDAPLPEGWIPFE